MSIYSEYLDRQMSFEDVTQERKNQLLKISSLRGRDVIVLAADLTKNAPIAIDFSDIMPFQDQLSVLSGSALDLILETPGGSGEVAEDLVHLMRQKYQDIAVIVPGTAKSAGTILAMASDEILMGRSSALGPIDAQMIWNGRWFSAEALLEGFDKIKKETSSEGSLNLAYVPMLQNLSPGEIQSAINSRDFAKGLVREWLVKHKFARWHKHNSSGTQVTYAEKVEAASSIADRLADHNHWKTHARSIRIDDLRQMGLQITDIDESAELQDTISRYYTLMRMSFDTPLYKITETIGSQIYRFANPVGEPNATTPMHQPVNIQIQWTCDTCGQITMVQADFDQDVPLEQGLIRFPHSATLVCEKCGDLNDLTQVKNDIERQFNRPIVTYEEPIDEM